MFKRLLAITTLLIACCSATMLLGAQGAAAQDTGNTYPLMVNVQQCDDQAACDSSDGELLGDITVNVTSEDDTTDYGSCVTSIDGKPSGCSVDVAPETTVAVTVDAASIPDGYAQLEYPVLYDVPAEQTQLGDVVVDLVLQQDTVPDDQDTDEEVSGTADESSSADNSEDGTGGQAAELPSTGSGSSVNNQQAMPVGFELFAAISLALAGGAFMLRRKMSS